MLRRKRRENIVEIADHILIARLVRHTAMATGHVFEIVPATAATILMLRGGVIEAEFRQQVGACVGITATTALRRRIKVPDRVHGDFGIRFLGFRRLVIDRLVRSGLGVTGLGLRGFNAAIRRCLGFVRGLLGTDDALPRGLRRLFGLLGLLRVLRRGLSICGNLGRSGLRRADGDSFGGLTARASGLQRCDELGLAHRGGPTKSHLLGELFELGQFHIFKIRAGCHWLLPFLGSRRHAPAKLEKRDAENIRSMNVPCGNHTSGTLFTLQRRRDQHKPPRNNAMGPPAIAGGPIGLRHGACGMRLPWDACVTPRIRPYFCSW